MVLPVHGAGGVGGDAGAAGGTAPPCNGTPSTGGAPGTQAAGGAGGSPDGQAGALGQGGNGGGATGGGAGGGLYGGGGGGDLGLTTAFDDLTPAGGGGGGSSLVPTGGSLALSSAAPSVTISYRGPNRAPTAGNDGYGTNEDTQPSVPAAGVLGNDSDLDVEPLAAVLVSGPAHGALTLNANGSFTYTPAADFNGADSFSYKANDTTADSNVATVTLTVTPVDDAPTCDAVSATTDEHAAVELAPVCSDIDSAALTYAIAGQPAHGTATVIAGRLRYTPAAGYPGADSFSYRSGDGSRDSAPANAAITVNARPAAPPAPVGGAPAPVLSVRTPAPAVFARAGIPARCEIANGLLRSCTVRLLQGPRVVATGSAKASGSGASSLNVTPKLTKQGRSLLGRRLGGVQTTVQAVGATGAGTLSASARTRAILASWRSSASSPRRTRGSPTRRACSRPAGASSAACAAS